MSSCPNAVAEALAALGSPDGPRPLSRALAGDGPHRLVSMASPSRRRRLWELPAAAHCPVVGICLPIAVLRTLLKRALGGEPVCSDHDLHSGAVTECRRRGPIAERLQRALDDRFPIALREVARLKSTEDVARWWRHEFEHGDVAAALWAGITHPQCDRALADAMLGDAHMLQHQLGASARVDRMRMQTLASENATLRNVLADQQERAAQAALEAADRLRSALAECVGLRARLAAADDRIARLAQRLAECDDRGPAGPDARDDEIRGLHRELARLRARLERAERAARPGPHGSIAPPPQVVETTSCTMGAHACNLHGQLVLCVGGRSASVPVYRRLVEREGARFAHHDGGLEDSAARLDAALEAADVVILQSGCVSHAATGRVKDHCRRRAKRCVFVEVPSHSRMARALREACAMPAATARDGAGSGTRGDTANAILPTWSVC